MTDDADFYVSSQEVYGWADACSCSIIERMDMNGVRMLRVRVDPPKENGDEFIISPRHEGDSLADYERTGEGFMVNVLSPDGHSLVAIATIFPTWEEAHEFGGRVQTTPPFRDA